MFVKTKKKKDVELTGDVKTDAINIVKLYQGMNYQVARGKGLGQIVSELDAYYDRSYDPYTDYIDNYRQQKQAEEHNDHILDMRAGLNQFLRDVIADEEHRHDVLVSLVDTGLPLAGESEFRKQLKAESKDDYQYLDMLMRVDGFDGGVLDNSLVDDLGDSVKNTFSDYHDIYEELQDINGMGDVHEGLSKSSRYYSDDAIEQKRLLQEMDKDVQSVAAIGSFGRSPYMEDKLYRYMSLVDDISEFGIDSIDKQRIDCVFYRDVNNIDDNYGRADYNEHQLKFMRDYNPQIFDDHFSKTVIKSMNHVIGSDKPMTDGYRLQPTGSFERVRMSPKFGNHQFSIDDFADLLVGKDVTISNYATKDGRHVNLTGNLQNQTYKGHDFVGFKPVKSEPVVEKSLSEMLNDYKTFVDTCRSEDKTPTKADYSAFTNYFGIGGGTYSADMLKQMRDYDAKFFDENMSCLTVTSIGTSEKTGKYVAKGMQLQSDGTFSPIVMNASYGSHKFDADSVGKLLTGQTVAINGFRTKKGDLLNIQGNLEKQEYKGHTYYGFNRTLTDSEREIERNMKLSKYENMTYDGEFTLEELFDR